MDFIRWNMQKTGTAGESNFRGGNGSKLDDAVRDAVFQSLIVAWLNRYIVASGINRP
jgi:hypothetical protein